jgi:hypothetical protein
MTCSDCTVAVECGIIGVLKHVDLWLVGERSRGPSHRPRSTLAQQASASVQLQRFGRKPDAGFGCGFEINSIYVANALTLEDNAFQVRVLEFHVHPLKIIVTAEYLPLPCALRSSMVGCCSVV